MELNRRSLRSMAFDGKVRQNSNGGCSIDFDMETPNLKVLKLLDNCNLSSSRNNICEFFSD